MRLRSWFGSALALVVAVTSVADAQTPPYNTTLLKRIDQYVGVNDVWGYEANGKKIAIYGHRSGTSFVDATDPVNATEVFHLPGPSSTWRDIKTYQNYAYIVTEGGGLGTGLQIVDMTDPLNPVFVSTYTANAMTTAHNLWIDETTGVAYACGASPGGGMHVLSLADPENPVEIDFFNSYYLHDLWVEGDRGYGAAINTATLRVMDTSDPANITTLRTHSYANAFTHNCWPNVAGTHVATTDENTGGQLKIWDVTNLNNIQQTSAYRPPDHPISIIHNALNHNDLMYCSWYTAGARIVDVTDPNDPVEVGFYDTSTRDGGGFEGCWGVYPFRGDNVFYASDRQDGLFIVSFDAGFAGDIAGTVRNATNSAPLDSAYVEIVNTPFEFNTDGTGTYAAAIAANTYQVITTRFGYEPDTSMVTVLENDTVVHDVDLTPLPNGNVEITLTSTQTALPVEGVKAEILNSPLVDLTSDVNGKINVTGLPINLSWTLRVGKFGFALTDVEVIASNQGGTTQVAAQLSPGFEDDFSADQAWIFGDGSDTATDGLWERATPEASFYLGVVGPDGDASPFGDGMALVTENHVNGSWVGTSDVDNGVTTVLTPVFDGTGLGSLGLQYERWFSNRAPSQGDDEFRCDISTDGGSSWTNLETLDVSVESWAEVSINLDPILTPTSTMQIRFTAEDFGSNQYVEAGIDNVRLLTGATDAPVLSGATRTLLLAAPSPNPIRDATTLRFDLPRAGEASLEIYDVSGRRVAELLRGERVAAGAHSVRWDARDGRGRSVAPGVYFAKLTAAGETVSRKVTVLR